MKYIFFFLLFLFFQSKLLAQDTFFQQLTPSIAYYGNNLWNPGIRLGLEKPWPNHSKWQISSDLGVYLDPGSHAGLFHSYGLHFRHTGVKGRHWQLGMSPLAYYRSFLPNTYTLTSEGTIGQIRLAGRSYFAPTASLRFGAQWEKISFAEACFIGLHLMTLMPYNTYIMPLFNIELGIRLTSSSSDS